MTEHDTDSWPTRETDTAVIHRRPDTLVGGTLPPVAPGPPPPGHGPDRRFGAGMLLALVALLVGAAGIAIAYLLTHRSSNSQVTTVVVRSTAPRPAAAKKVAVPRVVGLKEQQALLRLAQIGLRPKEVFRPTKQPKGVVVSQRPQEAKEVAKGSQVRLVIDKGAPQVSVPDLGGKSLGAAQAALDRQGLAAAITQVTNTGAKPGTIVDQAPKAGSKLAKGSVVTLSVARGAAPAATPSATTTAPAASTTAPTTTAAAPPAPQQATMPDVTSKTEAAAAQAMNEAGILPSLFFIPGTDPLGTVEQQAKAAGTTLPYHAHVQINISSGPGDKPKLQVPNVIGQTLKQAVASLNGAHLRLIYVKYPVSSRAKAGTIVQQSPLGGGKAPRNAQVLVFLAALKG